MGKESFPALVSAGKSTGNRSVIWLYDSKNYTRKIKTINKRKRKWTGKVLFFLMFEELLQTRCNKGSSKGRKMGHSESNDRFYFLGLQNYCRWWLQPWNERHLFLGRNALTNLHIYTCIKKLRHYSTDKDQYSQSYDFSSSHVWMWELDHKKAEHWRTDPFRLWCWRKLLRIPWTARSN